MGLKEDITSINVFHHSKWRGAFYNQRTPLQIVYLVKICKYVYINLYSNYQLVEVDEIRFKQHGEESN